MKVAIKEERVKPPYQFIAAKAVCQDCVSQYNGESQNVRRLSSRFSAQSRDERTRRPFAIRACYNPKIDVRSGRCRSDRRRSRRVGRLSGNRVAQYRSVYLWSSKNLNKFPATGDERLAFVLSEGLVIYSLNTRCCGTLLPATPWPGLSVGIPVAIIRFSAEFYHLAPVHRENDDRPRGARQ